MNAPMPGMEAAEDSTAEALLSSLKTIAAAERRKHASVFNYWLSIRGNKPFPPIRDLDPLEISDAGPFSLLLEMVGGGEDADIRHIGLAIKAGIDAAKVSEAPRPSLLSCIHDKLPIVAASRQAFAFEDEFEGEDGTTRCWVTLLPFSATGTWIDFVYGFVSLDPAPGAVEETATEEEVAEAAPEPVEEAAVAEPDEIEAAGEPFAPEPEEFAEAEETDEAVAGTAPEYEPEDEPEAEQPAAVAATSGKPGFSAKFFESLASVGGFYGRVVDLDPGLASVPPAEGEEGLAVTDEAEPGGEAEAVDEPQAEQIEAPQPTSEGTLQSKLADVRSKADEARQAKIRANAALYEGLSAVYDFALDAEDEPEEYLKLVEAQGLKIQLRAPMAPVVKLAFHGLCDDSTIGQLEAVLAWALKQELPRGSLAERIEAEGGIAPILSGLAKAA